MAKNSITDYDNIAANNTDIQSVDIDEGCAPSGINNAIRELMADLADVNDGTVPLASPDINGGTIDGVTIGGTTAGAGTFTGLTVEGVATTRPTIGNSDVNTSGLVTGLNFEPISNLTNGAKLNVISGLQPTVTSAYTAGFEFVTEDHAGGGSFSQTKALTIGAGGDISFYEDTGTTPKFFWDASAERLGLGTSLPDNPLHISSDTEPYIRIENTDTLLAEGQITGGIIFEQNDTSIGGAGITGRIQMRSAVRPDNGNYFGSAADMDFLISGASSGVAADNASKIAMTIRAGTGSVGIGTTSPSGYSSAYRQLVINGGANPSMLQLNNTTTGQGSNSGGLAIVQSGVDAYLINPQSTGTTRFFTNNTERMRIDSSGNVGIGTSSPTVLGSAFTTLNVKGNAFNTGLITVTSNDLGSSVQLYSGSSSSDNPAIAYQNNLRFGSATDAGVGGFTERMRIDKDGVLLVGATSQNNDLNRAIFTRGTASAAGGVENLYWQSGTTMVLDGGPPGTANTAAGINFFVYNGSAANNAYIQGIATSTTGGGPATLSFGRRTGVSTYAESMRIDGSGVWLLGTTTYNGVGGVTIAPNQLGGAGQIAFNRNNTTAASFPMDFRNAGSAVGYIAYNNTGVTYATTSDYRLKEDMQPMTGAIERVNALNPVNFAWKADGSRVDGFLAHEAQAVVPEAVTGTKDAMQDEEYEVTPAVLDEDGNVVTEAVMGTRSVPDYQGIDQSKLVPLLTAALQEAIAKIENLESRLDTLENA